MFISVLPLIIESPSSLSVFHIAQVASPFHLPMAICPLILTSISHWKDYFQQQFSIFFSFSLSLSLSLFRELAAESSLTLGIKIIMEGLGSSMSFNLQSFCWVCPSRGGGGRTGCGFTPKLKIQKANSGSNKCKLHIVPTVIILYWFTTCLSWGYDSDDFTSPITNTVGIGNHFTDGKDNLGPGRNEKLLIQPKRMGFLLPRDKIKAWN